MRIPYILSLYLLVLVTILFTSCYPTPNFPDKPSISLQDLYFVEGSVDSLVVTLSFEDGDGDLGLSSTQYPYHEFNFYSALNGEEIHAKADREKKTLSSYLSEVIHLSHQRTGAIDTLPPYEDPYYCTRWKSKAIVGGVTDEDTLYYQRNLNYYNILITFLVKPTVSDPFEELNFDQFGDCSFNSYNGRFPRLIDDNREKPLEGLITYKMPGVLLSDILERRIIKLRIYIVDRALNKSEPIETEEFILSEITI